MKFIIFIGLIAITTAIDEDKILKESNDQFTAKLFNEVLNLPTNAGKSVIFSGICVLTPLAQLALASVGESHDEIVEAINISNDTVIKEVFTNVNTKLNSVKGVVLKTASRIYIAKDATLNPTFSALSREVFNSDVKNVDFNENVPTANTINTWVEEQTNNKIKDLIDPSSLSGITRAILVNAIYFKGLWKSKFNVDQTKDGDFYVTSDQTVKVPFMYKTHDFRYAESSELDAKLLELPYEGDEATMLVVLPNKKDGLKDLQEKLKDPAALGKAASELFSTEVKLSIPKFKIETTTDLKEALQKIKVSSLFDPSKARLENLLSNESNLHISEAIQKAYIEVTEDGTEAAAANALIYSKSAKFSIDPQIFKAEHPFYFELQFGDFKLFSGSYHS